ncbi:MAG TPA: SDR family NAD(P)-dependent oxidoreductase [Polyangiales bacterium]|nr:SDR family NAD(P)-dependent oxidoreductase [Polyangiales bacterium]
MGRLQNKRAIVTGAASGIGRASAILFAREGAKLLIADRAEAGLEETRALIAAEGGTVSAQVADAGSETDVVSLIERVVSEHGGLDVIYANAGISGMSYSFEDTTVETFQEALRINLLGPFLMIKHGSPHMKKQGKGSIVCTASVAGIRSGAGPIAYSASKAGVINLVQTAANTLRGTGIRVNAICPGLIETGMTKPIFDYAKQRGTSDKIGQLNPLGRAGQPAEIAAAALFLASDEASYVTGQALAVDGGLTSSLPIVPPKR